jgi:hypothetical protein
MTQLLCAADQIIPSLLSQDEMKVMVYNHGGISHDTTLPTLTPRCCRRAAAAAAAAAAAFVFIVVVIAAIISVSVAIAAVAFS